MADAQRNTTQEKGFVMIDIQSIIVYLGLAVLCFFVAKFAELTDNKKLVWLIVLTLSLIAGLRALSVGIDSKNYDRWFKLIASGNQKQIFGLEASFIYICNIVLNLWNNTNFMFFLFALLSHGLVIFTLWRNREHVSFSWGVFSYYILFYAISLNGMRQFVAVAIVIYATNFVREGKYFRFILAVLTGVLFHMSALVGIIYILYEIPFLRNYNRKRKIILITICCLIGSLGLSIAGYLLNIYSGYFDRQATSVGIMMLVKILMLVLSILIIGIPVDKNDRHMYGMYAVFYALGIALNSLSYVFMYMGRIGLYFYVFEAFFIGGIFKVKNRTIWIVLLKIAYGLLMIYFLYDLLVSNRQGELPYRFIWQLKEYF